MIVESVKTYMCIWAWVGLHSQPAHHICKIELWYHIAYQCEVLVLYTVYNQPMRLNPIQSTIPNL